MVSYPLSDVDLQANLDEGPFTGLVLWFIQFQIALSFPAPVLALQPLPLESFKKSLDAGSTYNPASSPLSKRALTFADAVAKGNRFMCRLENPALLDDQSAVTSVDIIETSGWTRVPEDYDATITTSLQPAFDEFGLMNNPIDCAHINWNHAVASRNAQGQDVPVCHVIPYRK
jgi:hypothetical protein